MAHAPFQPNTFDAITCFDVLEHMHHPREVLVKVREWLKPGGVFYTFLPNIDSAESRIFRSYWCGLELPRHLYHFSPSSLGKASRVRRVGAALSHDRSQLADRVWRALRW